MKVKLFEDYSGIIDWKKATIEIYDMFCGLEDKKVGRFDYQCGYLSSRNHISLPCFLDKKTEKIEGDSSHVDHMIYMNSLSLIRVTIRPNFNNYSPFKTNSNISFYGDNYLTFSDIIKYVDTIKNKILNYKISLSLYDDGIVFDFLEKR